MRKSTWLGVCPIVGVVSLSVAIYLLYDLAQSRSEAVASAKLAARQQAVTAANEIDAELQDLRAIVHNLAEEITTHRLSDGEARARVTEVREENPALYALGVVFEAHAVDERADAFPNGSGWSEPIWDETEKVMLATYSEPFFRVDGSGERSPAGAAYVTISMARIKERMDRLELGDTGYGAVLSKQGYFLVHPSEATVRQGVSTFQMAETQNDEILRGVVEKATSGQSGFLDYDNLLTGQSSWFFFEPIRESGWSAFVIRITDEVLTIGRFFRRRVIWVSIYSIVGLMGVAVWVSSRWYQKRPRGVLWGLVVFLSLLFIAGSGVIRYLVYFQVLHEDRESVAVLDVEGLNAFLRSHRAELEARGQEPPLYVPTGVSLQVMKFIGPQELFVTGYVWQKFPIERPSDLPLGFTFPNAVSATMSEAYRRSDNGIETVGWNVEATLRQNLDISKYPFDHDTVSIRLWSKNFDRRLLLVPDLASYTLTNPTSRPGLHEGITLSGWRISGSYFDYKLFDYGTDFGIPGQLVEEAFPELNFNVGLKRNILNVAIRNMIPIVIVWVMLFAVLVTCTKDEDEAKLLSFGPSGTMRISSALFFVVLLAHIDLRDTLQIQEVAFVEYTYFVTYLAIILTTLQAFFFSLKRFNFWIVEYEESLIIKLAYWPLWLGFLFVVAIAFFY